MISSRPPLSLVAVLCAMAGVIPTNAVVVAKASLISADFMLVSS
jgi:hypothetical protein